jgi:hypothetical protein
MPRISPGLAVQKAASLERGPRAQLGARFHGMEEVIGSIPIRSTNKPNNLEWENRRGRTDCVIACVITHHFAALGKGFHCCPLGFHSDVGVPLKHPTADVSRDHHDGAVRGPLSASCVIAQCRRSWNLNPGRPAFLVTNFRVFSAMTL